MMNDRRVGKPWREGRGVGSRRVVWRTGEPLKEAQVVQACHGDGGCHRRVVGASFLSSSVR